jgi:HSP20 family protein
MNALMKGNQTLEKLFKDSQDALFGRTIDDILGHDFLNSFDANISEEQNLYRLEIAVPGMSRNDVDIRLDGRIMWVSAQSQKKKTSWNSMEFNSKHFQRSFVLPADADPNDIEAKCRNGLLTISIGKIKVKGAHRAWPLPWMS